MSRIKSLLSRLPSLTQPGCQPELTFTRAVRTLPRNFQAAQHREKVRPVQEIVPDPEIEENEKRKETISKVNEQIENKSHGRLFAVVQLMGKQRKVTDGDLLVMEGHFPPIAGDRIRLEKVLLVGSSAFTLLGRPLLRPDLVRVEATIVEKNLSHTKCRFLKNKRSNFMKSQFMKFPLTTLRINSVEITGKLDQRPEVEGVEGRTF